MSAASGRPRDRDPAGRPRSARPRDAAGRPLPPGSANAVAGVPDDLLLSPDASLDEAQRLLDVGRPFTAHEVLEAAWKQAPAEERELWRGLAQLAVGLTHLQRGNGRGAVALLRRAAANLTPYTGHPPYRVDVAGLVATCAALTEHVEASGGPETGGPETGGPTAAGATAFATASAAGPVTTEPVRLR